MPFVHHRTVRFEETDAAGVVYFANVLRICHEAYEASLGVVGIDLASFFSRKGAIAVPIAHASVDFFRPMHCGDRLEIHLIPQSSNRSEFEINYQIFLVTAPAKPISTATTRHVCIETATRRRQDMPDTLKAWLNHWGDRAGTDAPAPSP